MDSYMLSFKSFLQETKSKVSLAGMSRGSGKSKFETYVSDNWEKMKTYDFSLLTGAILYDDSFETEKPISGLIKILNVNIKEKGKSKFVLVKSGSKSGYVKISKISKPDVTSDTNSVLGGKNSKEFIPEKFGLGGKEFKNVSEFVNNISLSVKFAYPDLKYTNVKKYISSIVEEISGQGMNLSEGKVNRYTKSYTIPESFGVTEGDIKILSKNFGEIIAAIFMLKTNKKMISIGFPSDPSQKLFDFYGKEKSGRIHYFSAKSAGGSSTALDNLNFIKRNFSADNKFLKDHLKEMEIIDSLINSPGRNTISNIINFFHKYFPRKVTKIQNILGISELSQKTLEDYLSNQRKTGTMNTFVDSCNRVYQNILGDLRGKTPSSAVKTLKEMYEGKSNYKGGFMIYPMGSYITKFLNETPQYINALNLLMDFGSNITQVTVNMSNKSCNISVIKFSKNTFKFSYNDMSKNPGNRPIGFKEV